MAHLSRASNVARVLVNRIWQRVFAYGLVRFPEDFGLQGDHPTHPELLDFLALEFHKDNWDLKKDPQKNAHVKTFRQSSAFRKDINDPENKPLPVAFLPHGCRNHPRYRP